MSRALLRILALTFAATSLAAGSARGLGLNGDEVRVDLLTEFSGGFDAPTAVVSPPTEFIRSFQDGAVQLFFDVDVLSFEITYLNNGASPFNLGLDGFEISSLDFDDGSSLVSVDVTASTWPAGTFDALSFGPNSVSIPMAQPIIPGGTLWSATVVLTTPEPGGAALGLVAVAVLSLRRALAA